MAFELITDLGLLVDCNQNSVPDECEMVDCQPNGSLDECDIAAGSSRDCNGNAVPDECDLPADPDCNANLVLDACDNVAVTSVVSTRPAVLGFVNISGTGTPLGLTDDGSATVVMPFVLDAVATSTVRVSNNGGVGFGQFSVLSVPNTALPSTGAFNGDPSMLVYWTDLDATTGNVYFQTVGSAPSRTFIVQWHNRPEYPGDAGLDGDEATFQLQIFETPVTGVVAQYLYSDTNFLNAGLNDGASATVGFQRSSTDAAQWSFDTPGAVTPAVVLSLLRGDRNGSGVPDECEELPAQLLWDADPNAATRTTRSVTISAVAVTASGGPGTASIRVEMIDLQNPAPSNPPCCPAPNFSAYESATCTAIGELNGCARWVGPPVTIRESQENVALGTFLAARLQCTPYYTDWTTLSPVSIFGAEITPSSTYELTAFAASCKGTESTCTNISAPIQALTRRSGDVASSYNPPSASGQPDALDVVAMVNKFRNSAGAPSKRLAQIQPNLPELNQDINAIDIVTVVDAFRGLAYPYSGPCPCPSAVTCGATPCTSAGQCSGGLCVKTCNGGGSVNQPCLTDAHCPASTCGSGFCRDRCGRCN
jgi:hypothetical protein